MEDLPKIELSTPQNLDIQSTQPVLLKKSMRIPLKLKSLKIVGIIVGIFIIMVIIFGALIGFPAYATYKSAVKTESQAKKAWDAIKKQNIELASKELSQSKKDLQETQNNFKKLAFLKIIPIASWYYNDADHLINAGFHGLAASEILVDSVKPYADILGLKGQGSFVMGSAEQRIQVAVATMGKITPRIDDIAKDMVLARKEIDQINPKHYPSVFEGDKIKKQIITVQTLVDQGVTFVEEARPLIKVLPTLLGEGKEKKYLVIFQNDKELRPTGGFITAYSVFRIDKGIIHVDKSGDIYDLDNGISAKPKAPDSILKYLPKVPTLNLRDSNLSPDFIESMKTFNSLYDKAAGKVAVDGIIALDTHVLISTIKILDDEIFAAGIKFTTKNDERCDCPQVIYVLEDEISRPVNYVKTGRKDLLGALLYAIMEKALKSSPKVYWGPLVQGMIEDANEKHVLFYFYDKNAQTGVEALNAAGRIKEFEGDYFHFNETNFAGGKANLYVKEAVEQDYEISQNGVITKKITVSYKNNHEPSDCNLERGGLCLNAVYRDWFRMYVPKGSKLVSSQGSEVKVTSYDELGKTVFEGFLTVKPLGKAELTVSYELPFKLKNGSPLPVLFQKQPGTDDNQYSIKIKGKTVEKFPLLTDKKINLTM